MSIVEGVDDDVLFGFFVLFVLTVLTVVYFVNLSGNYSFNFFNAWRYVRSFFETLVSEEPHGDTVGGDSGSVQDNETEDQHRTVQTESANESHRDMTDCSGLSRSQTEGQYGEGLRQRTDVGSGEPQASGGPTSAQNSQESASGQLSLRIKHHEVERSFAVDPNITLGDLKRLSFPDEVSQGRRVRLIFSGRLLHDDNANLSFYGISNFSVIHAQISDIPQQNFTQQGHGDDEAELDISRLFIPLLTFILCGCWYGLISYRQLFNSTSTVILVIVTAAYAFMVYVMLG